MVLKLAVEWDLLKGRVMIRQESVARAHKNVKNGYSF